jgi:hypothetical protein
MAIRYRFNAMHGRAPRQGAGSLIGGASRSGGVFPGCEPVGTKPSVAEMFSMSPEVRATSF